MAIGDRLSKRVRDAIESEGGLGGRARVSDEVLGIALEHPRQRMGYSGVVPSEHSSGGPGKARRGAIAKTGNAHLRRVRIEAAWSYRHRPRLGVEIKPRQQHLDAAVKEIAWKAQHRLHTRYVGMSARGKPHQKLVTAVARERLGFVWAIATHAERGVREHATGMAA